MINMLAFSSLSIGVVVGIVVIVISVLLHAQCMLICQHIFLHKWFNFEFMVDGVTGKIPNHLTINWKRISLKNGYRNDNKNLNRHVNADNYR